MNVLSTTTTTVALAKVETALVVDDCKTPVVVAIQATIMMTVAALVMAVEVRHDVPAVEAQHFKKNLTMSGDKPCLDA